MRIPPNPCFGHIMSVLQRAALPVSTPLRKETKVNIEMAPRRSPPQIISRLRPLAITSFPPDLLVIPSTRTRERVHAERARSFAGSEPYFEVF